jgi:phosphate binding protein
MRAVAATLALLALLGAGCGRERPSDAAPTTTQSEEEAIGGFEDEALSGRIQADGSSTVAPLVTLAAERFRKQEPGVKVSVGVSGTGGGFERFCAGETDLSDASRAIEDEEKAACQKKRVAYRELQVANDGLSVVVNADNDWVDCLTVEQLKKIWQPGSKVDSWKDVDPSFPDEHIELFGRDRRRGRREPLGLLGDRGRQRDRQRRLGRRRRTRLHRPLVRRAEQGQAESDRG